MVFQDFTPHAPAFPFTFRQFLAGPHENFTACVADPATGDAALVDPTFELSRLFAALAADGITPRTAWFTHGHWDHIGGIPDILEHGVKTVVIHEAAADHPKVHEAREAGAEVRLVQDGDRIDVGGLRAEVLHTPGHQPEGSCFLVGGEGGPRVLFGGDTLFIDTCGRTDFPGGDTDAMFASMARLRGLEGDITVVPGHHYAAHPWRSLEAQRSENPALATLDRAAFGRLHCLTH